MNTSYSKIDETLRTWSGQYRIHMYEKYQDTEVRSFDFVDINGNRYQLWIDPPDEIGLVGVHAWDYGERRFDSIVGSDRLFVELETARGWIQSLGPFNK